MSAVTPRAPGLGARQAALRTLDRVLRTGQTVDAAAGSAGALAPADRALALAIVGETLRRLPDLDALIDSATRQRVADDSKARMVLRLALAQRLALNVPDHAIVSTALPLVDGGPRRLVHGVLGTLLRRKLDTGGAARLPDEVEARWTQAWGSGVVAAARRQIVQRVPLDLTFADASAVQDFAAANTGRSLAPRHVRLASQSVTDLPGYDAGEWWVQDLAASLPARLVPLAESIVDLCAAPGGKTMQLVAAGHRVTALDSSPRRLERLQDNLARTRLEAKLVAADAMEWQPDRPVAAILLDAPCSATGTFRRHPEVLHRVKPRFIGEVAERQRALLERAAAWLEPGGALIYSVCSLEPEEGEHIVRNFLAANGAFSIDRLKAGQLPDFVPVAPEGWVRILPGLLEDEGGLDGFFVARLVRAA